MNITLPTGLPKRKIIIEIKKLIHENGKTCMMNLNDFAKKSNAYKTEQDFIDGCAECGCNLTFE